MKRSINIIDKALCLIILLLNLSLLPVVAYFIYKAGNHPTLIISFVLVALNAFVILSEYKEGEQCK